MNELHIFEDDHVFNITYSDKGSYIFKSDYIKNRNLRPN